VLFVYYPDLVRHLKSIITTGGIEPEIKKQKKCQYLMRMMLVG
jgi:DNA replication protein DnaC